MSDRDFVVKNGLVVNSNLIVANSNKVGILTASPDAIFTVNGTANVSGNATLSQRLTVTGAATLSNTLVLTGNATFSNQVAVTGAVTLANSLAVTGAINATSVTVNNATINNLTVVNTPTFTNIIVGNATFTNTVNMTGANANITGTLTAQNANVSGGFYVGNSTTYATINSSGAGYFTGNLRVIGSLIVVGNTVQAGATEQAGDLVPSINGLKLGNTTNRWELQGSDATMTGNVSPFATGGSLGTTLLRWNVWANSLNVSNAVNILGPLTVETSSIQLKSNSTYTVISATGNTTFVNTTIQSTVLNVTGNTSATGANLNVTGTNTYITSNVNIAGTNTLVTSNTTFTGANVRINGANLSVTSNVTVTGANFNVTGGQSQLGTAVIGDLLVTGGSYANITANSQQFKANSTVVNMLITGNGTVSNVTINGDQLTVNSPTAFNNTFIVTALTQVLKSNSTSNVVSIFSGGGTTNTRVEATNLFVDANSTLRGTNTYITSNATIDGTLRVNANTTITGSNLAVTGNLVVIGTNMNVSSNATFTGTLNATTLAISNVVSVISNTVDLNVSNAINIGANVDITTTQIIVGNSTVNAVINSGTLTYSSPIGTAVINSTAIDIGSTVLANAVITVGATSINATHYTGNVFWANVSGRPTAISSFTNDLAFANATNINNIGGTANNTSFVGVSPASSVVNATALAANLTLYAAKSGTTFTGDLTLGSDVQFIANGSGGTAGQVLTANGTGAYWRTMSATVSSVGSGNGLTGGPITTTGTLAVLAGTGIISNTLGVHVNPTYIATINSNNASYLGGAPANSYANTTANFSMSGNVTFSGANIYCTTKLSVGPTLTINTTSFDVGATTITSGVVNVGGGIVINTTAIVVGGVKYGNNATGNRYVSTAGASGGVAGDIWLQYL